MKNESNTQLKRSLGLSTVMLSVIGMVIGSGVFFKPQAVYTITGGAPGIGLLIWVFAGLITLFGGLTTAELAASIPKTGGLVSWVEKCFGQGLGYLLGWCESVVFWPANVGALGTIFSIQALKLIGVSDKYTIPFAIFMVFFLIVCNCLGANVGGMIGNVFTVAKLVPLAVIILMAFTSTQSSPENLTPFIQRGDSFIAIFATGMLTCMYAYDGWIHVGNAAGEMKNPKKDLPKAIVLGLSIVILVYAVINIGYLLVIPADQLANTATPAADVVAKLMGGNMGAKLITVGILIAVFGTLNSNIMMGMRIPYAMGVQNKLPFSKQFAYLHPKYATPVVSGIFLLAVTSIMIISGSYNSLTDMCMFVIWIFYTIAFYGVIKLRRDEPDLKRPYKTPLYPLIPILAILGGLFVVIITVFTQPVNALIGVGLTLLGLPIYLSRKDKFKDLSHLDEDSKGETGDL